VTVHRFPVGYRAFHPDPSFNFELNRWLSVLPEDELRALAGDIHDADSWTQIMLAAADRSAPGSTARAFYWRAAEFFLDPDDPRKRDLYERFVADFDRSDLGRGLRRERVPYGAAWLPAIVVPARGAERETILLHGGFDSFMEELVEWADCFAAAGHRVVLFEGPGQGAALRRHGLVMRPDWEHPVAAVLDHFAIERCTIVGISLGGYLAPRAAAFEPRIRRVVACDVLADFFDCFTARAGDELATLLRAQVLHGERDALNALAGRFAAASPQVAWAIAHGREVSGARDAFEFFVWLAEMSTASFSARITQDFLLLAGAEDHIVPLRQFYRQAEHLPNVRSFTGRVFGAREHAASHCQIGNVGLALRFVLMWLDFQLAAEADGLVDGERTTRSMSG
jgi:pimeloyl-ACP methyl ester carboxylesterase